MTAPASTGARPDPIASVVPDQPLLRLIERYKQARDNFNGFDGPRDERLRREARFLACVDNLNAEMGRGTRAISLEEAKAATRLSAREFQDDNELSAQLALAALAYFLGSEAVS